MKTKQIEFKRVYIIDDYKVIGVWAVKCENIKDHAITYSGGVITTRDGKEFESHTYTSEVFDKRDDAIAFANKERKSMLKHLKEQVLWYEERIKELTNRS